jgi:hypothetical protein
VGCPSGSGRERRCERELQSARTAERPVGAALDQLPTTPEVERHLGEQFIDLRSSLQSWIDPGAVVGGEDGRTGLIAGAGVAGAASDGAGMLDAVLGDGPDFILGGGSDFMAGIMDAAPGGGPDFMDGVSTSLLSCLWGGLKRVSGGLPSGGG